MALNERQTEDLLAKATNAASVHIGKIAASEFEKLTRRPYDKRTTSVADMLADAQAWQIAVNKFIEHLSEGAM